MSQLTKQRRRAKFERQGGLTSIRGRQHFRSARELQNDVLNEIQKLETRAHQCGLLVTAHALNGAKNACGWEMAGDLKQARLATQR